MIESVPFRVKYKPKLFSETVGLEQLERLLESIIIDKRFSPILIVGSYGSGKTTLAELIIIRLQCVNSTSLDPCLDCDNCRDLIENRSFSFGAGISWCHGHSLSLKRLDYYQDTAHTLPMFWKYNVIFIDELETASTEVLHRLPAILDRYTNIPLICTLAEEQENKIPAPALQRFKIIRLPKHDIKSLSVLVHRVCDAEDIEITNNLSIELLIKYAGCNPRSVLNILEILKMNKMDLSKTNLMSPIVLDNIGYMAGETRYILSDEE